MLPQAFYYHLHWRTQGLSATAHATRYRGTGVDFCGYASLLDHPNPRHLDIRASIRSLPRQQLVRTFYERGSAQVYAIADLSSSMDYRGAAHKQQLLAEIAASIAWSANLTGDSFALISCDSRIRADASLPLTRQRNAALEVRQLLQQAPIKARTDSSALTLAASQLPQQRCLVFLLSDFHLQPELLSATLRQLSPHDVIPILLWDSQEYAQLPTWGWAKIRDMETGQSTQLFMRKGLQLALQQEYQQRLSHLKSLFSRYGMRPPFLVQDHFNAEQLSQHLLS